MRFRAVLVGFYGSCHDARVFTHMKFVRKILDYAADPINSPEQPLLPGSFILADEAYPLCAFTIPPYPIECNWLDRLFFTGFQH